MEKKIRDNQSVLDWIILKKLTMLDILFRSPKNKPTFW